MLTRVQSDLSPDVEALARRIIDCLITVHRVLGPGYKEAIYERATCLELDANSITCECEKSIMVPYKTWLIPGHKIDLIVEGRIPQESVFGVLGPSGASGYQPSAVTVTTAATETSRRHGWR